MLFALQQIHNPSVRQQFPNFPFKAKEDWWVGGGGGGRGGSQSIFCVWGEKNPHKNKTKNNNNPQ